MTQETVNSKNSVLEAFLKQRAKRQNNTFIEAKRLVNLYRHLSLFGDEFLETYNKMLLDSSPEVQMALPDIVGGAVVRQYFEFLKGRAKQNDTDSVISEDDAEDAYKYRHEESYLPSPDEVQPFVFSPQTDNGTRVADTPVAAVQLGAFEQALEKQNAFLTQALEKINQNVVAGMNGVGNTSDLSSLQQAQKELLSELLEKQNAQMNANIDTILKQTQELSARQLETVEKLAQRVKSAPQDAYAVMIEEEAAIPAQDTSQTVYTSRYRSEEKPVYHPAEVELEPIGEMTDNVESVSGHKRHSTLSPHALHDEADDVTTQTMPDWKG